MAPFNQQMSSLKTEASLGLVDAIEQVPSNTLGTDNNQISSNTSPFPIDNTLKTIFHEPQVESRLQKARQIMGEATSSLTDEELTNHLTEFQFLIDSWFDVYEKQIFEGLTLNQVLREE